MKTLAAAATAGVLLLPTQLATAQPAQNSTTAAQDQAADSETITIKVGISQDALADLRSTGREAREQGRTALPVPPPATQPTQRAPGQALPAPKQPPLTLLEGAQTSSRTAASASTPATAAGLGDGPSTRVAAPIEDKPNSALLEECFNAGGADTGIGRVHNRFTYCARVSIEAEYWSIDSKGVPIEKEGDTTAKLELFAQGDDKDRRTRIFSQIQKDSVDYDWGPIDNIFVAPNVPLSLLGQCLQDTEVCHATRGSYTLPWTVWDNNPEWAYWDVYNHEETTEGRDKISYNQWAVEFFTENAEYKTFQRGRTAPRLARCDSASYFNFGTARYPKACVFSEVTPYLTYTLGSDHHAVAEHIDTAQNRAHSTYPLLAPPGVPWPRAKNIPGKYIPGNPDAPGLHRITKRLHPTEYKSNSDHKDGACYKTGPERNTYLDTGLPNRPPQGEQCDEYPFASTLEGAGNPTYDFSVKSIPARDNRVAGGMLRKYYVDDRILAWDAGLPRPDTTNDRFYVHIR
ncbi:NucA/NucB deoxyribonuclease domain-containing protein [Streptomyces pakalii]|uniref:NucA/NucB deoxyribonuclease domain-containing protein n=1 Tax=Streptomyces pakalii TaxID=3036494 RepID=A0ABT7DHZ9_9ACTN|nr:NucA/NucB deoxyribonuclease domain-containing protein [Streptomyces pakalii]MDJ1645425.1 NucA/NucB deoxyribonuclease domain-containing protein [Streptomyces pakalii]